MRCFQFVVLMLAIGVSGSFARACGGYGDAELSRLAQEAVSGDETTAKAAIAALRERGQEGLAAVRAKHPLLSASGITPSDIAAKARYAAAVDGVACQRDASASGLFWYTDLEQAKAAAKASGKPIISLRLLGNLTDELSCANSRFFRTVLYANSQVSNELRSNYVLHWSSERPVPKITIDFGDGRKIERTITGNSVHYILDSNGRLVDPLPGLYGPKAFLRGLAAAKAVAQQVNSWDDVSFQAAVRSYHGEQVNIIAAAWSRDLAALNIETPGMVPGGAQPQAATKSSSFPAAPAKGGRAAPGAVDGARVTEGKAVMEMPMIRAMMPAQMTALDSSLDDKTWAAIAALHVEDARLDEASIQLIRAKNPDAYSAAKVAISKSKVEDPLVRVTRQFQRAVALDTVKNEYVLHRKIHEWFAASEKPLAFAPLNNRVYAELFLTPRSDPWLGLVPADTYTALDNDGLITAAATR